MFARNCRTTNRTPKMANEFVPGISTRTMIPKPSDRRKLGTSPNRSARRGAKSPANPVASVATALRGARSVSSYLNFMKNHKEKIGIINPAPRPTSMLANENRAMNPADFLGSERPLVVAVLSLMKRAGIMLQRKMTPVTA